MSGRGGPGGRRQSNAGGRGGSQSNKPKYVHQSLPEKHKSEYWYPKLRSIGQALNPQPRRMVDKFMSPIEFCAAWLNRNDDFSLKKQPSTKDYAESAMPMGVDRIQQLARKQDLPRAGNGFKLPSFDLNDVSVVHVVKGIRSFYYETQRTEDKSSTAYRMGKYEVYRDYWLDSLRYYFWYYCLHPEEPIVKAYEDARSLLEPVKEGENNEILKGYWKKGDEKKIITELLQKYALVTTAKAVQSLIDPVLANTTRKNGHPKIMIERIGEFGDIKYYFSSTVKHEEAIDRALEHFFDQRFNNGSKRPKTTGIVYARKYLNNKTTSEEDKTALANIANFRTIHEHNKLKSTERTEQKKKEDKEQEHKDKEENWNDFLMNFNFVTDGQGFDRKKIVKVYKERIWKDKKVEKLSTKFMRTALTRHQQVVADFAYLRFRYCLYFQKHFKNLDDIRESDYFVDEMQKTRAILRLLDDAGETGDDAEFVAEGAEVDDETTLKAEESLGREMSPEEELAMLQAESKTSIESLYTMHPEMEAERQRQLRKYRFQQATEQSSKKDFAMDAWKEYKSRDPGYKRAVLVQARDYANAWRAHTMPKVGFHSLKWEGLRAFQKRFKTRLLRREQQGDISDDSSDIFDPDQPDLNPSPATAAPKLANASVATAQGAEAPVETKKAARNTAAPSGPTPPATTTTAEDASAATAQATKAPVETKKAARNTTAPSGPTPPATTTTTAEAVGTKKAAPPHTTAQSAPTTAHHVPSHLPVVSPQPKEVCQDRLPPYKLSVAEKNAVFTDIKFAMTKILEQGITPPTYSLNAGRAGARREYLVLALLHFGFHDIATMGGTLADIEQGYKSWVMEGHLIGEEFERTMSGLYESMVVEKITLSIEAARKLGMTQEMVLDRAQIDTALKFLTGKGNHEYHDMVKLAKGKIAEQWKRVKEWKRSRDSEPGIEELVEFFAAEDARKRGREDDSTNDATRKKQRTNDGGQEDDSHKAADALITMRRQL